MRGAGHPWPSNHAVSHQLRIGKCLSGYTSRSRSELETGTVFARAGRAVSLSASSIGAGLLVAETLREELGWHMDLSKMFASTTFAAGRTTQIGAAAVASASSGSTWSSQWTPWSLPRCSGAHDDKAFSGRPPVVLLNSSYTDGPHRHQFLCAAASLTETIGNCTPPSLHRTWNGQPSVRRTECRPFPLSAVTDSLVAVCKKTSLTSGSYTALLSSPIVNHEPAKTVYRAFPRWRSLGRRALVHGGSNRFAFGLTKIRGILPAFGFHVLFESAVEALLVLVEGPMAFALEFCCRGLVLPPLFLAPSVPLPLPLALGVSVSTSIGVGLEFKYNWVRDATTISCVSRFQVVNRAASRMRCSLILVFWVPTRTTPSFRSWSMVLLDCTSYAQSCHRPRCTSDLHQQADVSSHPSTGGRTDAMPRIVQTVNHVHRTARRERHQHTGKLGW